MMTIRDLKPAVGCYYRQRATGQRAVLRKYRLTTTWRKNRRWCTTNDSYVRLVADDGWEWIGTADYFWDEWIHEDLYDPTRN